jgi:hypothetical protein
MKLQSGATRAGTYTQCWRGRWGGNDEARGQRGGRGRSKAGELASWRTGERYDRHCWRGKFPCCTGLTAFDLSCRGEGCGWLALRGRRRRLVGGGAAGRWVQGVQGGAAKGAMTQSCREQPECEHAGNQSINQAINQSAAVSAARVKGSGGSRGNRAIAASQGRMASAGGWPSAVQDYTLTSRVLGALILGIIISTLCSACSSHVESATRPYNEYIGFTASESHHLSTHLGPTYPTMQLCSPFLHHAIRGPRCPACPFVCNRAPLFRDRPRYREASSFIRSSSRICSTESTSFVALFPELHRIAMLGLHEASSLSLRPV